MRADEIEAAAKALRPYAFGRRYEIGCGSGWHYEAHSCHSCCPSCGSNTFEGRECLDQKQLNDQEIARREARKAIGAVERLRRQRRAQQLLTEAA